MWSLEQETNVTTNNHYNNRVVSSTSSSRSSPSCNSSIFPQTPRRRTMEEVWKDITNTAIHQERSMTPLDHYHHHNQNLHHQHNHHYPHIHNGNSTPSPSFTGMILQDFLAGPLTRPLPAVEELPLPPPPLQLTALSLSSGFVLNYIENPNAVRRESNPRPNSNSSSGDSRVIGRSAEEPHGVSTFVSPPFADAHLFSYCPNKRLQESSGNGGDRRHKRMIKNRESAARSRARKQAYTNELELEVAHLLEENANLKKQHEELRVAMATQIPTRNNIQRSSSSPF